VLRRLDAAESILLFGSDEYAGDRMHAHAAWRDLEYAVLPTTGRFGSCPGYPRGRGQFTIGERD